jgi:hypothetical protein
MPRVAVSSARLHLATVRCPQGIARKGHYGAFLMEDWDLVSSMIRSLHEGLSVPVTCKIRVFDDAAKTIEYAKMIEASGCQVCTTPLAISISPTRMYCCAPSPHRRAAESPVGIAWLSFTPCAPKPLPHLWLG